jgi:hypothetical protein
MAVPPQPTKNPNDPLAILSSECRRYIETEGSKIQGWLAYSAMLIFAALAQAQTAAGITGHLVEIGVWEGRTFLFFARLIGAGERAIGFDLELKPSLMARLDHPEVKDRVDVHEISSLKLGRKDFRKLGPIRIFHIDGGHDTEHALHDLRLAFGSVSREGVVALDDFFAPTLPGVTQALFDCASDKGLNGFVPFAIAGNKCWLCHISRHDWYKRVCLDSLPIRPQVENTELQRMFGGLPLIYLN